MAAKRMTWHSVENGDDLDLNLRVHVNVYVADMNSRSIRCCPFSSSNAPWLLEEDLRLCLWSEWSESCISRLDYVIRQASKQTVVVNGSLLGLLNGRPLH